MTHAGILPALGCRCRPCHAARLRVWRGLTHAQRRAIEAMDFAIPRHPSALSRDAGVRRPTLAVLTFPATRRPPLIERNRLPPDVLRPALVRMHYLAERIASSTSMPFYTLNQHGAEILAAVRTAERKAA